MICRTFSLLKYAPLALLLLVNGAAEARTSGIERGRRFAEENCSRCHAVGPRGSSPVEASPPFRTLRRYLSMKDLAYKLTNGELGDHPVMPHWLIDPEDVKDLVSYIETIQTKRR